MKKVLVVTGTRADYGIYYPILKAIDLQVDMELHLLVTGMHLSHQHGYTVKYIEKDGFRISSKIECLLQGSTNGNMARSIGIAILGMTQAMEEISPDCVIILGDRGEMLAAAIVSSHLNIPLLHLHGGEVSGTIDESVRHAISKLSHIHLVATEGSKVRLRRLGEDPWRIHVVGAPRIETILTAELPSIKVVKEKYGLNFNGDYFLFVYHPVTTQNEEIEQLDAMINVLLHQESDVICILPNADAGSDDILAIYLRYENNSKIHYVKSFEQFDFLTVLKYCNMMIGNSSSGIIEAASFHIPVINIGSRQNKRERSRNIIDISANPLELKMAIEHAQMNQFREIVNQAKNVYDGGDTSNKVVEIIRNIHENYELIQKTITY